MSFTQAQEDLFKKAEKTEAEAIKQLEKAYQKARRDLLNAVGAEQARGTEDALRRSARFQALIDEILDEIGGLQQQTRQTIETASRATYRDSYNRLAYEYDIVVNTTSIAATGEVVYLNFPILDRRAVTQALFNPDVAGRTFSPTQFSQIMANQRRALQQSVRDIIANIIATGQGLRPGSNALKPLFEQLGDAVNKAKNRALTTIRTETLRAFSLAQMDADQEAVNAGIDLSYKWNTARDERVRASHRQMQDQKAQFNAQSEPFFQYPDGTRTPAPRVQGSAGNVINCRCRRTAIVEGFEPSGNSFRDQDGNWQQNKSNLEYESWKREWKKRVT